MEDLKYQDKYIKYKNKYLKLKAYEKQLTNINNKQNQTGGNYFYSGTYVFFLNKYHIEKLKNNNNDFDKNRKIDNFDTFTNILGNCAYFLRLGTTFTGKDFAHTYDTIYPNNSIYGSVERNVVNSVMSVFQTNDKSVEVTGEQEKQVGGAPFEIKYICHYKPIRLSEITGLKDNFAKGFFYHEDIESIENLTALVNGINNIIYTQYGNEVNTILIIEKFANTNPRAEIIKKYKVDNKTSTNDKYGGVQSITEITNTTTSTKS